MTKVYISTNDPICYYIMDEQECADTFGDDFIDDFGQDVPEELVDEYKKSYKAFWDIQGKIRKIVKP